MTSSQTQRAPLCDICSLVSARVTCIEDKCNLCEACDLQVHSANPIANRHTRWHLCASCGCAKATVKQASGPGMCRACLPGDMASGTVSQLDPPAFPARALIMHEQASADGCVDAALQHQRCHLTGLPVESAHQHQSLECNLPQADEVSRQLQTQQLSIRRRPSRDHAGHPHISSHATHHDAQHADDVNHPGVAPQHASRYQHLTTLCDGDSVRTDSSPELAAHPPFSHLPGTWVQQPEHPEPRWSNDSGLSLALDAVTALSPAASVLALHALQPYIQPVPSAIGLCQAPVGCGINDRLIHERCIPGTTEFGWDNSSALGTSHAWSGGPDVNLAQQDVFDTLFGTWVMERSGSPEAFPDQGVLGKHDPTNDYFANMWEDSFICGAKQPPAGPWMQAPLQQSFSPLQAEHFQPLLQADPFQQNQNYLLLQQEQQAQLLQHHHRQEQEGRQRVELQRMISQQARQLLADEQLVPVMSPPSCAAPIQEHATRAESVSSRRTQPALACPATTASCNGADRQQSSASGSQSAERPRTTPVQDQGLQRTRRMQAQLLQQRAQQKVDQDAMGTNELLAQHADDLQQQQGSQKRQLERNLSQAQMAQEPESGPAPILIALATCPSTAMSHPVVPPPVVDFSGAASMALDVGNCFPSPMALQPVLLTSVDSLQATTIKSALLPAISYGPLAPFQLEVPSSVMSAPHLCLPVTSVGSAQPVQSVALLPPSLPLTWAIPAPGAESCYPQVPTLDPSLLAALTAGWQPPSLPAGLAQLPAPTPGAWRPAGLPALPPHLMLPPAVMLMHMQAAYAQMSGIGGAATPLSGSLYPGMPPLPLPSLPSGFPFLLPPPGVTPPHLTPAQLQALSHLAPPSQPNSLPAISLQLPPPSLPIGTLPLPALSAPNSIVGHALVPKPVLSLHLSQPLTPASHLRPALSTSSLAPAWVPTPAVCTPAPAMSATVASVTGNLTRPAVPSNSACSPATHHSATSLPPSSAAVTTLLPPTLMRTLNAASRPGSNAGMPASPAVSAAQVLHAHALLNNPLHTAASTAAAMSAPHLNPALVASQVPPLNNTMFPAMSALSAGLLSGLPGSLSQSLATSFPQVLAPAPFAQPLSYLMAPHMLSGGGAAASLAAAGAASAAAAMMPSHPLLAGLSPEAVQRIMAPMAPWLLPNTLPAPAPLAPAFYPGATGIIAAASPSLTLNQAGTALPQRPTPTPTQTTMSEILNLASSLAPARPPNAPATAVSLASGLHLGSLSQQQVVAAAASMLSGGLGNPFAAMLAQARPNLLTPSSMPTPITNLLRNSAHIPPNPFFAGGPARTNFAASGSATAGPQQLNQQHNQQQSSGACFSHAAAAATNRSEALRRYRQKRSNRHFEKTIRYASRQDRATKRPRVKGRFIKQELTDSHMTGNHSAFADGGDCDGPEPATTATTAMARADTNNTAACGGSVCSGESSELGDEVEMSSSAAAAGQRRAAEAVAVACLEQQGSRTIDAALAEQHHSSAPLDRCGSTAGRASVAEGAGLHHPAISVAMQQPVMTMLAPGGQHSGVKRILSCSSIHTPGQGHLPQGCTTDVSASQAGGGVCEPVSKIPRNVQYSSSQVPAMVSSFLNTANFASPGLSTCGVPPLIPQALQHQQSFTTGTFQSAGGAALADLRRYSTVQQQLQPLTECAQVMAQTRHVAPLALGGGGGGRQAVRADSTMGVIHTAASHHPELSCGSCDVFPSAASGREGVWSVRQAVTTGADSHLRVEAEEVCSSADAACQQY